MAEQLHKRHVPSACVRMGRRHLSRLAQYSCDPWTRCTDQEFLAKLLGATEWFVMSTAPFWAAESHQALLVEVHDERKTAMNIAIDEVGLSVSTWTTWGDAGVADNVETL